MISPSRIRLQQLLSFIQMRAALMCSKATPEYSSLARHRPGILGARPVSKYANGYDLFLLADVHNLCNERVIALTERQCITVRYCLCTRISRGYALGTGTTSHSGLRSLVAVVESNCRFLNDLAS